MSNGFVSDGFDDLTALVDLEQLCFPDPWSEVTLNNVVADEKYLVLVLRDEAQKPLGYLIGSHVLDEAELVRIAIIPEMRGQGLGRLMLDAACEDWRAVSVERVFLEVRPSNFPAISLYESSGFATIATRTRYYDDGEDALVMRLELSPVADD